MRALVNLRCLAILGVFLCANVSFGDLVVSAVLQDVRAAAELVSQNPDEDYVVSTHTSLPLLTSMTIADPNPPNVSAAYGRATQAVTSYQGPSTLGVSWQSPLSVTAQLTADAKSPSLSLVPADGLSTFELTFLLSTPHAYSVSFSGALTNSGDNSVSLTGPGVDKLATYTVGEQWSGTLQPGLYTFGMTAGSLAFGDASAAVSTGQLSLTAVPEPSAFLLLGLVTGAVFSVNWLSRVSRPDTVES